MTQISRPFQIALLAAGLLMAVWFVALRGHSSGSGAPSSPPAATAPATSASSGAEKAAAPSPVYHGAAPGVGALTHAIAKAHGAVAESQKNEKQLEMKSAQASSATATGGSSAVAQAGSSTAPSSSTGAGAVVTHTTVTKSGVSTRPPRQALVEQELKQGSMVVMLFWNPKGSDDIAVHRELQLLLAAHHRVAPVSNVPAVQRLLKAVGLELGRNIAVHYAPASQVASFGSITRGVQVFATPTILIVNKHGKITTLTGFTDAFSIEQAIDEARHA